MTERPNLVAGDAEGTPLEDTDHLVNGRVPGKGSGYFTETADGAVTPTEERPISVEESFSDATVERHRRFTARDKAAAVTDFENDGDVTFYENFTHSTSEFYTPSQSARADATDAFNDDAMLGVNLANKGLSNVEGKTLFLLAKFPTESDFKNHEHIQADFRSPDFDNRFEVTRKHIKFEGTVWTLYSFPFAARERSITGSPDLTSADDLRIHVRAKSGESITCYLDSLWFEETTESMVSIVYDDAEDDVFNSFLPVHQKYAMPGNIAVIPDYLGNSGFMVEEELEVCKRLGWDLANHTWDQTELEGVDAETAREKIEKGKAWLKKNGYHKGAESFVLPLGGVDEVSYPVARDRHTLIRNTVHRINSYPVQDFGRVFSIPTKDYTVSEIQDFIDRVDNYGGWLVLYAHNTDDISTSDLDSVLSYVDSSGAEMKTFSDVMDMQQ